MGIKNLFNNLYESRCITLKQIPPNKLLVFDFNIFFHKFASSIESMLHIIDLYSKTAEFFLKEIQRFKAEYKVILFIDKGEIKKKIETRNKRKDFYPIKQEILHDSDKHIKKCLIYTKYILKNRNRMWNYNDIFDNNNPTVIYNEIEVNDTETFNKLDEFIDSKLELEDIVVIYTNNFDAEYAISKLCTCNDKFVPVSNDQDIIALSIMNNNYVFVYNNKPYYVNDVSRAKIITYLTFLINSSDYFYGIYGIACHIDFINKIKIDSKIEPDIYKQKRKDYIISKNQKIYNRIYKAAYKKLLFPDIDQIKEISQYLSLDIKFYQNP